LAIGRSGAAARVLAGAVVGYAFLIRPTFLGYLPVLMLADCVGIRASGRWVQELLRRWASTGVGFAVVILAALAGGWAAGSLDAFYEQAVLFNLQAYPSKVTYAELVARAFQILSTSWHWLAFFALLGLVGWVAMSGDRRSQLLIVGLIATIVVSYFFQRKGFGYHLEALLLPLCFLCAILVEMLRSMVLASRDARIAIGLRAALISVLLVAVLGTGKKLTRYEPSVRAMAAGQYMPFDAGLTVMPWQQMSEAAEIIRKGTKPDETVLQWGRNFEVLFLSERRSTTRFVSTPALDLLSDRFAGSTRWLQELEQRMTESPPRFVLIDRSDLRGVAPPYVAPDQASDALKIVVRHLAGYTAAYETDSVLLLRRP
jgi:hypothetical protein